jgi:hypothetical protein
MQGPRLRVPMTIDDEVQHHIRTCGECEVVINTKGQGRVLACGWWYGKGMLPPWPPPGAKPGLLADAEREYDHGANP